MSDCSQWSQQPRLRVAAFHFIVIMIVLCSYGWLAIIQLNPESRWLTKALILSRPARWRSCDKRGRRSCDLVPS